VFEMIRASHIDLDEYLQAEREMRQQDGRRGFTVDAVLYLVVNAVLITVNLVFVPEFLWFIFPLVGWGIGLTFNYLFGVRWAAREAAKHEERVLIRSLHDARRAA
jgi:uncharacterized membrane protein